MRNPLIISSFAAALLLAGSVSAFAACNGDTGTETVLGAASGAAVGGLASHSVAGAAIGGVAGGLIGNAIGQSNNRDDCRREAQYYDQQRQDYYQGQRGTYDRPDYNEQAYQQQDYYQQQRDYERRRQAYEQQRQAYDERYGRRYDNDYSYRTYPDYPRSSRYDEYPDGD